MRVLQVMASGARGGGATHLLQMMPALHEAGITQAAAVGPGPLREALIEEGFDVASLDLMRRRLAGAAVGYLARLIRLWTPDVVHFHGLRAAFAGAQIRWAWAPWAWAPKVRTVYTIHGLAYRQQAGRLWRWLLQRAEGAACRSADAVVSVSRADLDEVQDRGFIQAQAGYHISNPVRVPLGKVLSQSQARARLGLPEERFTVGTTSRLVPQKAVSDLLDAMEYCPDGLLAVVGEGPERDQLMQHPTTRRGQAVFLGDRGDVPACLAAWDVFALSSRWEGEPIALLEAMACGLPCVATATVGAREVLQGSGAGVLVEVGSPKKLGWALQSLAGADLRRKAMGQAGQERMRDRHPEIQAQRLKKVYQSLL